MEDELLGVIATRLKEIRKHRGFSQEYVKNQTGINVSDYENAKRCPKICTLFKLAQLYEVKIDYFLT